MSGQVIEEGYRRPAYVQPHSMADDFRGEAVAVVRVGWWRHPSVSFIPTPCRQPRLP
jgi:hypothetical protein